MRFAWVACLAPLLLTGCFLGADPLPPGTGEPPDAGPPPPPDATPPPMCVQPTQNQDDGHHNPGLDCMAGNCHGPTGSGVAPRFSIAGTLYAAPTGTAIVKYATISILDAAGTKVELVTSQNGNFYSGQILKFPIQVFASECPAIQVMTEAVQDGSCNACHAQGLTQGQMTLPPQ